MNAVVALAALVLGGQDDRLSFEEVKRVDRARAIDGRLDDPAWTGASRLFGFTELFVREPGPAKIRTDALVAYDAGALYLAAQCHESQMGKIRATFTGRDNPLIWRDDCVELYIDPTNTGESFYKITLSAAGGVTDQFRQGRHYDATWNAPGMKTAVVRAKDAWLWELRLPWTALSRVCPQGRVWTFCLVRFAYSSGRLVGATWSPGGHSGTPGKHGLLCFGPMLDTWIKPVAERRGRQWRIGRPGFELRYRSRAAAVADLVERIEQDLAAATAELAPVPDVPAVEALRQQLAECRSRLKQPAPLEQDGLEGLAEQAERVHWHCRIARLLADGGDRP